MGCQSTKYKVESPAAKKMEDVSTVPDNVKTMQDNKKDDTVVEGVEQAPAAGDVETVKPSTPKMKVDDSTELGQEPMALTTGKEDSTAQHAEAKDDAQIGKNEQTQVGVGSSSGEDEVFSGTHATVAADAKPTDNDKLNGQMNTTQETSTAVDEPKEEEQDGVQISKTEGTVKVSPTNDESVAPPPAMWGSSLLGGCCHGSN